ncbi:hypothetical protein SRO_0258 [Streptomyces rochei]|nr:hypothetical protein SRO_0258 [Streptomyces rochei]
MVLSDLMRSSRPIAAVDVDGTGEREWRSASRDRVAGAELVAQAWLGPEACATESTAVERLRAEALCGRPALCNSSLRYSPAPVAGTGAIILGPPVTPKARRGALGSAPTRRRHR